MRKSWTITDFALVWLGGVFASLMVAAVLFEVDAGTGVAGLATLGAQYAGIVLVIWLLARLKEHNDLGLSVEPKDVRYAGLGMLLQIAVAILLAPLVRLYYPEGGPPQEIANIIGDPANPTSIKVGLFTAAVVFAPLTEELTYRGVLYRALRGKGKWLAIIVSTMVFTAVHVLGLDQNNLIGSAVLVLPPIFGLGLLLAWLTERSGRLGPALFLHSGWNLLAAAVLLIPGELLEGMGS